MDVSILEIKRHDDGQARAGVIRRITSVLISDSDAGDSCACLGYAVCYLYYLRHQLLDNVLDDVVQGIPGIGVKYLYI